MWAFALFIFTLSLLVLPLLPAIRELLRPTDVNPLLVLQTHDNNPMHFADGFRKYIARGFSNLAVELTSDGKLQDGTEYQIVGTQDVPKLDLLPAVNKLVLSSHSMTLPGEKLYEKEVYSAGNIRTGSKSYFRAILADKSLNISESSGVFRWVHSNEEMVVEKNTTLMGRATSGKEIALQEECYFERIYAPQIFTLSPYAKSAAKVQDKKMTTLDGLKDSRAISGRRHVVKEGLDIPAHHIFDGDIVTNGHTIIGNHSHIRGGVKTNVHYDKKKYTKITDIFGKTRNKARFEVGDHVTVDGSLFSTRDMYIGKHAKVKGPIVAEGLLVIGEGSIIGSPETPCSVIAPEIIIEGGCVVYGTLWATKQGYVKPLNQGEKEATKLIEA